MWFVAVARIGQTNGSLVVADCSAAPAYSAACAQCTASAYIQRGLPKTGQGLILPACNTEAKNLCLAERRDRRVVPMPPFSAVRLAGTCRRDPSPLLQRWNSRRSALAHHGHRIMPISERIMTKWELV